jgi:hypothetical protein
MNTKQNKASEPCSCLAYYTHRSDPMPIQCCQTLAEFMANADYCTEPESCGIYYNPGKTGDIITSPQ